MLKIFRKLRKRLLKEGSLKSYLFYAVGEIMLVMVGILLALQVNNWSENLKTKKIEKEYLIALQEEFSTNLTRLDKMIKQNEACIKTANELAQKIGSSSSKISEKEFSELFGETFKYTTRYNPSLGVLKDVVNSGNLNKISNAQLRKKIAGWEARLLRVHTQEEGVHLNQQSVVDLLKREGSFKRIMIETSGQHEDLSLSQDGLNRSNKALLQNTELENNLLFFIVTSQTLSYAYYKGFKEELQSVLEMLNEELK